MGQRELSSSTSKINYLTIIILFTTNSTISNSLFHFITFLFPSLPTHHTSFLLFIPLIIINNLIPFWFSRPFPAKRPAPKRPLHSIGFVFSRIVVSSNGYWYVFDSLFDSIMIYHLKFIIFVSFPILTIV